MSYEVCKSNNTNTCEDMLECSICLDPLQTSICTIECGHKFHTKCLIEYAKSQEKSIKCPICRGQILETPDLQQQEMVILIPQDTLRQPDSPPAPTNYHRKFTDLFVNTIIPIGVIVIIGNLILNGNGS